MVALVLALLGTCVDDPWPSLPEVLASPRDLWGERAMREPGGASYEAIAPLLPPLRYVDTDFRHYPIVLSAPEAALKARFVSNGSGINLRAGTATWSEVSPFPVEFLAGAHEEPFGADLACLTGPSLERDGVPIVKLSYAKDGWVVGQEAFAGTGAGPAGPEAAAVFVRFSAGGSTPASVVARVGGTKPVTGEGGVVRDADGRGYVWHDSRFVWDQGRRRLVAGLEPGGEATLVVFSEAGVAGPLGGLPAGRYAEARRQCAETWQRRLRDVVELTAPEEVVNRAWRASLAGILMTCEGARPNYSAQNHYQVLFQAECGDAVRALLLFGVTGVKPMVAALLDRELQAGLGHHDVAFKLQMLAHCYWLTRDADLVRGARRMWSEAVSKAIAAIDPDTGLLPKEAYCGDISQPVHSLSVNANLWRGLRDLAAVLSEIGETRLAEDCSRSAARLRERVVGAVARSERLDVSPPFVPVALFGEEAPYPQITATRLGSYWNLMAPYVLGSGVFGFGGDRNRWISEYVQSRGGLCMGMVRFHQHSGLFANEDAVDDLYTLRYFLELLQRDDVERAIVAFYGKLAHGLTRDTFVSAEGTGLKPLDPHGRPMYLPPNIAASGTFLWMLRWLLVQDWDADDDGHPETLRLAFATPRRWLEEGRRIVLRRAPTAFGPVSLVMSSRLSEGSVTVEIVPPPRRPAHTRLRVRLPVGWTARRATCGDRELAIDASGTLDLGALTAPGVVQVEVGRTPSVEGR